MKSAGPGAAEVTARLRRLGRLADLAPERRLASKVDPSPAGVTRRLRAVAQLRRFCLACAEWGRGLRPPPVGAR